LPPDVAKNINDAVSALHSYSQAIDNSTKETEELIAARKEQQKIENDLAKQQRNKTVAEGGAKEMKEQIGKTKNLQQQSKARM
jgi:hypothetical protein